MKKNFLRVQAVALHEIKMVLTGNFHLVPALDSRHVTYWRLYGDNSILGLANLLLFILSHEPSNLEAGGSTPPGRASFSECRFKLSGSGLAHDTSNA
ncbi:MAG: hypothetical protein POG74_12825, partial [Acidocella sp.]|nr:hypothetical protein [Acidocella sp.]